MPSREEYAQVQPWAVPGRELSEVEVRTFDAIKSLILELTDEQRAECELFAGVSPGVAFFPSSDDPEVVEVRWADLVIGFVSATWLATGVVPDTFTPPL